MLQYLLHIVLSPIVFSCLDDPLVWGIILRCSTVMRHWDIVRWVPGAHEICFEGKHMAKLKGKLNQHKC